MRRLLLVVVALMVAAGCSDDPTEELPAPPTTVPLAPTTTAADLSGVALAGVAGRTTTTLSIGPGSATMRGTVVVPEGAVPGATVRLERLVGDAVAAAEVPTNPDGTWEAKDILGGRYRVRAWRAPDLAMTKPEVFFLEAREARTLNLRLSRFEGVAVTSDIAPNPPEVNAPASLVVLVTAREVDTTGVVRANPVAGVRVELAGSGWRLDSANATVTDSGGQARWQVRCRAEGVQNLSVVVNQQSPHALEMPPCSPSTAPPSTSTSTTVRGGTTSTTRRTTSTTS